MPERPPDPVDPNPIPSIHPYNKVTPNTATPTPPASSATSTLSAVKPGNGVPGAKSPEIRTTQPGPSGSALGGSRPAYGAASATELAEIERQRRSGELIHPHDAPPAPTGYRAHLGENEKLMLQPRTSSPSAIDRARRRPLLARPPTQADPPTLSHLAQRRIIITTTTTTIMSTRTHRPQRPHPPTAVPPPRAMLRHAKPIDQALIRQQAILPPQDQPLNLLLDAMRIPQWVASEVESVEAGTRAMDCLGDGGISISAKGKDVIGRDASSWKRRKRQPEVSQTLHSPRELDPVHGIDIPTPRLPTHPSRHLPPAHRPRLPNRPCPLNCRQPHRLPLPDPTYPCPVSDRSAHERCRRPLNETGQLLPPTPRRPARLTIEACRDLPAEVKFRD